MRQQVDVHLPIGSSSNSKKSDSTPQPTEAELDAMRSYLAQCASPTHSARLVIPDEIASLIQDSFVASRKTSEGDASAAEGALKRRMRIARSAIEIR